MSRVAIVGSFPDQLLTHLKAADYTVSVYESFSKYPQDNQDAPVAVIAYGADIGLDSTNAVKLLKSNVVLFLFSPSNDLLQSIKIGIDTVIDLPNIKLADGIPLIIYRLHASDRFHFVPGFSLGNSEDGMPKVTSDSELLKYSVELIAKCTSHAREVVKVSYASNDTSNLEPPTTTLYYKTDSVTIVNGSTTNWTINMHCYAANWMPGKDFTSKGGKVYVVMTHTGHVEVPAFYVALLRGSTLPLQTDVPGGFAVELQSPHGGTKQDRTYFFNAALKQVFNLFQGPSGSPKPFTFSAEYSVGYSIPYVNQFTRTTGGFGFAFDNDTPVKSSTLLPIRGVSVFSGGLAKIAFNCEILTDTPSQVPLDVTFGYTPS